MKTSLMVSTSLFLSLSSLIGKDCDVRKDLPRIYCNSIVCACVDVCAGGEASAASARAVKKNEWMKNGKPGVASVESDMCV